MQNDYQFMARKDLLEANRAKKDEFYTQMPDIANELRHYKQHFAGKTVFCNCDDPYESNFFKFFALNFNDWKLKKLIATCYDGSPVAGNELQLDLFGGEVGGDASSIAYDAGSVISRISRIAHKIEITEVPDLNGDGATDLSDVELLLRNSKNVLTRLRGNGDFRSPECVELLREADIVVTNPPFSLFREYVAQLVKYDKKFLILGNMNAITYKEIFPLIKENRLWAGYGFNMSMVYKTTYENKLEANRKFVQQKGYNPDENYIKVPAINWFTNLEHNKRYEKLDLYKNYTPEEYPKYDNYNAINVDKVADIPMDYFGEMGVPITFLDKYCPEQFEIIGQGQGNLYRELTPNGLSQKFVDDYYASGQTGSIKADHPVLGYYDKNAKPIIPYMRIIIRRCQPVAYALPSEQLPLAAEAPVVDPLSYGGSTRRNKSE